MSRTIIDRVREGYGEVARSGLSSADTGIHSIAEAFGYSAAELASIPAQANMGLSCGNPVAMASLREGEVVVDLGAGGGLDVLLAAQRVGPQGQAVGIDMTEDMVMLARSNGEKSGLTNIAFHFAEIEAMPLADDFADCVISNCVLNLVADKPAALAEVFRILKPGGRLAISDIALKQPLPEAIREDAAAWVSCIAGAVTISENQALLEQAGFTEVMISDSGADLNVYKTGSGGTGCCGPAETESACCGADAATPSEPAAYHQRISALLEAFDFNAYAASVKIFALKPDR